MEKKAPAGANLASISPEEFRSMVRRGEWTTHVMEPCFGYAKFNLVAIPKEMAFDFLLFAQRNPQACAVTDVTEPGDPHPKLLAPHGDLRTDLPRYHVFQDGQLIDEPTDIVRYWQKDLVAFLIGSISNIFSSLSEANVQFRFLGDYTTTIPAAPAGRLHGPMIATGALFRSSHDAIRAIQISSRLPAGHGAPIHIGDPSEIGITDLYLPDKFHPHPISPIEPAEVALFWGCGVTPQSVALKARTPFMITHKPGHLFVSDRRNEELAIL
jgi:uncharacterized protein YcsI (UPF0317 family)